MIVLQLVDVLENKVLAVSSKRFTSLDSAFRWLQRQPTWKRGGLVVDGHGSGPAFHVQALAVVGLEVKARWIFMERRTTQALVGPNGDTLPGSEQVTNRQLIWVRVEDGLALAFAQGVTP